MVQSQESMDTAKRNANPQAQQDAAVNQSLQRIKNKIIVKIKRFVKIFRIVADANLKLFAAFQFQLYLIHVGS